MTYYYDEVVRSRRRAFAAGVVAGALVIALIWVTLWAVGSSGLEEPAPATPTGEPLDTPPLIPETAQNRLTRCEEVFAAQTPLLETLAGPLSQWRKQISRTNKLVTGVITLDEGLDVWDQTRVEVINALAQYRAAREAFDERTARCPGPNEGTRGLSSSSAAKGLLPATQRSAPRTPPWAVSSDMSMTWSCSARDRSPTQRRASGGRRRGVRTSRS